MHDFADRVSELRRMMDEQKQVYTKVNAYRQSLVADMMAAGVREIPVGLNMFRIVWNTSGVDGDGADETSRKRLDDEVLTVMEQGVKYSQKDIIQSLGKKTTNAKMQNALLRLGKEGKILITYLPNMKRNFYEKL